MRSFWLMVLISAFPLGALAQTQHAREWYCVRQPMAETTDGNVVSLNCVAALPKADKLDTEDEEILSGLEVIRWNASTLTAASQDERANALLKGTENPTHRADSGKEIMSAIRMGFGQKVGQLCKKHPNIVLAPLFPDSPSSTTTLYGCKNIIVAHEK